MNTSLRFRAMIFSSVLIISLILSPVLTVFAVTVPAEINKSFSPIAIVSGATSKLRITVYNLNGNDLTSATWTDDLIGVQPGLSIANPPNVTQTCGGTVTDGGGGSLDAGDTSIMLANGTVPAQVSGFPGDCYVEVDVTSTTPGNLINTIPANELSSFTFDPDEVPSVTPVPITNTTPASATLNVIGVQPPSLSKSFAPNTVFVGATSTLTVTIRNNDTKNPLTETTLTDTLPTSGNGDVELANPVNASLSGCGSGTLTDGSGGALDPGDTSIRLNNGTIAANSTCVIAVDVTSLVQGAYTNTIPAGPGGPGSIQTREGVTNASLASAPLKVQAFTLTKAFAPTSIAVGDTSVVTISIQNHAAFDYTDAALDDVLPAGLEFASGGAIPAPATTCETLLNPATVTIETTTNTDDTIRLTDGTLPAGTTCTIAATVSALMNATEGIKTNTIPAGDLSTFQGATNHAPASANLDVQGLSIAKEFLPTTFAAGGTGTLTITISNPSQSTPFTGVSVTDTLPTGGNGDIYLANPVNPTLNGCGSGTLEDAGGGVGSLGPGDRDLVLVNGTIAANSDCVITVDVSSINPDTYTNTIPAGAVTTTEGGTNPSPDLEADVTVTTISVNKTYNPTTVAYPATSLLTITIFNPVTGGALTDIELTDVLPAELEIAAAPAPATTCDDSTTPILTAVAGTQTISLDDGSLPAAPGPGAVSCTITVPVIPLVGTSSGTYSNTIDPGDVSTSQGPENGNSVTANLTVQAVGISKAFQYANFQAGGTSWLRITLINPTGADYTVVSVTDNLPAGLEIAPHAGEAIPGPSPAPSTTCTGGTLDDGALGDGNIDAGDTSVRLNNGTIAAYSTCEILFYITGSAPGSYTNTIPIDALTTTQGPKNKTAASAPVTVYTFGQGIPSAKSFNPSTINIFGNSRLRLTFTAPADTSLSNFAFTDTLPGAVVISNSTPATTSNCGGSVSLTAVTGTQTISMANGDIAAGATCTVDVYVTSDTGTGPGIVNTNTIQPAAVTSTEARTMPGAITDTLTVQTPSTLDVSKAFYPDVVHPDGLSTLTITLENEGTANLIDVTITDTLPGTLTNGVIVAPTPNFSTTCDAGVITAVAGSQMISMANGTIPAQVGGVNGICTINVDVQGKSTNGASPAAHNNIIPPTNVVATIQGSPSTMNAQGPASDILTVKNLDLEVVKGFIPQLVYGGADSEMSIILRNPNTGADLTGISFTDNMPPGMILVNPPNFDPTDCGPDAVLTGIPGTSTFSFSDGFLGSGDECTLTLDVTMTVNGNLTNTIPALAVTSFNGARNQTPTSATLTNLAGASISKSFAPNPISAGLNSYSILTITIRTTATVNISGIGLVDTLPTGLQVAGGSAPAPTNGCGGTLAATPGATTIQLSGGALPVGFSNCLLTIPVTGANPGIYTNTIPPGTLVDDQGVTNIQPAEDVLTLTGYSLGNLVWFDTDNNGLVDGGEVGVENVRVELYRDDGTSPGVFDASDTYLGFETTDSSGHYRFDDLGSDDYVVTIPADNFRNVGGGDNVAGDPLEGYLSSGTTIAANGAASDSIGSDPDNDIDNDDNGVTSFTGNAVNYVSAQAVTIGPGGSEPTGETDPTTNPESGEAVDNQSNRTVDFGFYRLELGDQIFQDINEDGTFDGGDAPLAGAIVQLFASNGTTEINVGPDGILGTADDAAGGMTSDASGNYLFSGMPEGSYIVKVLPTGYPSTIDTFNSADSANPNTNADENDNGVGTTAGTVFSNIVTLNPGSAGALSNNTVTNATGSTYDPTVDFGYVTALAKLIITTDAAHTTGTNVAIGEIVTYEVAMIIPISGMNTVQLVDTPQAGLAFVDCVSISLPTNVTSTEFSDGTCDTLDGTTLGVSNPLIENSGGQITFNFGDITNTSGSNQVLRVRYTLIVLDILSNQDGDSLTNDVAWTWDGGSRITNAPLVNIVEPELTIGKDASPTTAAIGDIITFTIDLAHSAPSSADAFDVVVTDQIPTGLAYFGGSLVTSGTATVSSEGYNLATNTIEVVWDIFRLTETARVTFQATYVGPAPVINSTNAEWTSLEIDPALPGPPSVPAQLSPYNTNATERWYDPAAPAGVNGYGANDSVAINSSAAETLPKTGFAPGEVTELPEQPLNNIYTSLGDLWLEIPSLDLNTSLTGIPQIGTSWDIQWLWDQAGYLKGTSYPGLPGNTGITAHVYLPNGLPGPFVNLHTLKWGEEVILHANGQRYIYQIRETRKVWPNDLSVLKHEDFDWITLITCQGYNEKENSYDFRTVVRAVLIDVQPE